MRRNRSGEGSGCEGVSSLLAVQGTLREKKEHPRGMGSLQRQKTCVLGSLWRRRRDLEGEGQERGVKRQVV